MVSLAVKGLSSKMPIGFYYSYNLLNHWWMNFMLLCCVYSNVSIVYRGGWWDGWWGRASGMEDGKKYQLRYS